MIYSGENDSLSISDTPKTPVACGANSEYGMFTGDVLIAVVTKSKLETGSTNIL